MVERCGRGVPTRARKERERQVGKRERRSAWGKGRRVGEQGNTQGKTDTEEDEREHVGE